MLNNIIHFLAYLAANPDHVTAIAAFLAFASSEILGVIGHKGWFPLLLKAAFRITQKTFALRSALKKAPE